jgi:hypothetical protein
MEKKITLCVCEEDYKAFRCPTCKEITRFGVLEIARAKVKAYEAADKNAAELVSHGLAPENKEWYADTLREQCGGEEMYLASKKLLAQETNETNIP